jgi:hypothetical protein
MKPTFHHPTIMQPLSVSLALFFGTILATTDAAPRGLKSDAVSASLGRMLMGGGDSTSGGDSKTGDNNLADFANFSCRMLETFDNIVRDENNIRAGDGLARKL